MKGKISASALSLCCPFPNLTHAPRDSPSKPGQRHSDGGSISLPPKLWAMHRESPPSPGLSSQIFPSGNATAGATEATESTGNPAGHAWTSQVPHLFFARSSERALGVCYYFYL